MNKLVILGIIIIILGLIFTGQSQSVIGPNTSFMYNNPDWLSYGLVIVLLGVIIIVMSFVSRR